MRRLESRLATVLEMFSNGICILRHMQTKICFAITDTMFDPTFSILLQQENTVALKLIIHYIYVCYTEVPLYFLPLMSCLLLSSSLKALHDRHLWMAFYRCALVILLNGFMFCYSCHSCSMKSCEPLPTKSLIAFLMSSCLTSCGRIICESSYSLRVVTAL